MARRKKRTPLQAMALFEQHGGICHICGQKIDGTREGWDLEHVIALEISGDDSDENLRPAHKACHAEKTRDDKGRIAKAKRVRAKHLGAKKKRTIGYRKFDGTPVYPEK